MESLVPTTRIQSLILMIRGRKIVLDSDLATLYGVSTKRLNEQVTRNMARFPDDFMFRLTPQEKREVVAKCNHLTHLKFSSALPRAFTEHGAIMAASVLNTPRAIEVGLAVVRAFVALRAMFESDRSLARKLERVERRILDHDRTIHAIVVTLQDLMSGPVTTLPRIGFPTGKRADA